MKLSKKLEERLKIEAIKELEKGKPDWDVPHTLNAVKWMKKLIKNEGGNEKVLIPAIYLHDAGYPRLKNGYDYEDMMKSKKLHARRGAQFAKKILPKIGGFSEKEIMDVVYLVANHDKHTDLESHGRRLVFEADGLSMIDWEAVTPNFDRKNRIAFLDKYFANERGFDRWHTKTGKKYVKILLKKAYNYK